MPPVDLADYDVAYIAPARSKMVLEMSFRFRIIRDPWSPDYTEYRIEEYDIHRGDVAIVGFGANPTTDGGLRSLVAPMPARLQKFSDVVPDATLLLANATAARPGHKAGSSQPARARCAFACRLSPDR